MLLTKNFFVFFNTITWLPTSYLGIFIIYFFIEVNICFGFYINRLHFNSSMICIVVFFNYVTQFINIHIFWYWRHIFVTNSLFNKAVINLLVRTYFPSYVLNAFLYYYFVVMISMICYKISCLYQHIFCLVYVQIHLKFSRKRQ